MGFARYLISWEANLARSDPDKAESATAAGTVANDLAQFILTSLTPGAHLPSEAELAVRYAVSRLTVREAVKLLEGRGLIEIARGRKATVREPDGTAFTDFLAAIVHNDAKGVFDLVEVRLSLEVQSATLAAKRANRAGIAAIESALERMRDAARRAGAGEDVTACERDFNFADVGFHEAIALSSGNRILSYLFEAMAGPLQEGFFISRRGSQARGQTLGDTIDAHQKVLDAIRDGNGRAAGEAMRNHLKDTMRDIRVAVGELGGNRIPPAPPT